MKGKRTTEQLQRMQVERNKPLQRVAAISVGNVDEASRTIELSISSEEARVPRWWGDEILGHGPNDIRMERIQTAGSFLFAHGRDLNHSWMPIGSIKRVWLDQEQRKLRAEVCFDDDEESMKIMRKVQSGSIRGVSIGYQVYRWVDIEENHMDSERGIEGPCGIASDWEPFEISLEPIPADPGVGPGRSVENDEIDPPMTRNEPETPLAAPASQNHTNNRRSDHPMGEKELRAAIAAETDEAKKTELQRQLDTLLAERTAERQRTQEIRAIARAHELSDEQVDQWINDGTDLNEVRKAALDLVAQRRTPASTVKVTKDGGDSTRAAMTDGIALRAGLKIEKPADGANDFRYYSLLRLAEECLVLDGRSIKGMSPDRIARDAATGSTTFANIMGTNVHRSLLQAYAEVPVTYTEAAKIVNAQDYRTMERAMLSEFDTLELVLPGAEYTHGGFSDQAVKYKIAKYGRIFSVTEETIINDELQALSDTPQAMGASARRYVNSLFWSTFLGNPNMDYDSVALFHSTHGNLVSGTGKVGAPTVETLKAAKLLMSKQKGLKGQAAIGLQPAKLFVPSELAIDAWTIINSTVDPTKSNATPNPFQNRLTVVEEPLLSDSSITGYSATAWYLESAWGYGVVPAEVAFLGGQDAPRIDSRQGFDTDGIEYKVKLPVGVKIVDHRGWVKNPGA